MKTTILVFLIISASLFAFAQDKNVWYSFSDTTKELTGFKDIDGNVMIEPKFMGYTVARRFINMVAVMEEVNGSYESYYLLKNGKEFGTDSMYVFDATFDCEKEGYIRFRDSAKDKTGFFDSTGTVAIPALYNDATPFCNGVAIVLKDAKKEYRHKKKHKGCNHWSWVGGTSLLIDQKNNILVEGIDYDIAYDYYSLEKSGKKHQDTCRVSYLGTDKQYYSMIDMEKHFKVWLVDLLENLDAAKLVKNSMDEVSLWTAQDGWIFKKSGKLITENYELLHSRLTSIRQPKADYFISLQGLNPYIYSGEKYFRYFDGCGNADKDKYPVFSLVINHQLPDNDTFQDNFDFLKTSDGYKLISYTLRNK